MQFSQGKWTVNPFEGSVFQVVFLELSWRAATLPQIHRCPFSNSSFGAKWEIPEVHHTFLKYFSHSRNVSCRWVKHWLPLVACFGQKVLNFWCNLGMQTNFCSFCLKPYEDSSQKESLQLPPLALSTLCPRMFCCIIPIPRLKNVCPSTGRLENLTKTL